jgi:hypothetical protein
MCSPVNFVFGLCIKLLKPALASRINLLQAGNSSCQLACTKIDKINQYYLHLDIQVM